MRKFLLITVCLLTAVQAFGQKKLSEYGYRLPLDIPALLSANYGELRPNHFHGGLDFKTQGVIGKPVYAVADGYVSRVAVSPYGFGKAIYILHPNGTTSVYGHVEDFYPELEAYVHEQQYEKKSFRVDLQLPASKFPVKKGDLIAYSGNRGGSAGPHLHFELRDGAQRPYNLMAHNIYTVQDTIPPRPVTLYFVSVDSLHGVPIHRIAQTIPVKRTGKNTFAPATGEKLTVESAGYFALEIEEKKNGADNHLGVYKMEERVDGNLIFGLEIDLIGFDVTRYVNAAMLYPERSKRNGVYRLFTLPNNDLKIYRNVQKSGLINPPHNTPQKVEIKLLDDNLNESTLAFEITRRQNPTLAPPPPGERVMWWERYTYSENGVTIQIPEKALYESTFFHAAVRNATRPSYAYSSIYDIHTRDEGLQKHITIAIDAQDLPPRLREKALLGMISAQGKRSSAGGKWKNGANGGSVEASVRDFGAYYITVDTVAPRITAQFTEGQDMKGQKSLNFKVTDDFSGVQSYTATIDGKWALFEHDPKESRLTHFFDDTRWEGNKTHEIVLKVTDGKGNQRTYKGTYRR